MSPGDPVPTLERPPFLIRSIGPDDVGFLRSIWTRALAATPMGEALPDRTRKDSFRHVTSAWISRVLDRPGVYSFAAADVEHPDTVIGLAVYTARTLHIVYVRPELRGFGVATALLGGWKGISCSLKPWKRLTFDPSALWDESPSSKPT